MIFRYEHSELEHIFFFFEIPNLPPKQLLIPAKISDLATITETLKVTSAIKR